MNMYKIILNVSILSLCFMASCRQNTRGQAAESGVKSGVESGAGSLFLADPTIFLDSGTYYLYGTGSPEGFRVYTSGDLVHWSIPAQDSLALRKGESYGEKGFWAPQVFCHNGQYYMAYTANENIAIAVSSHPAGPFRQDTLAPIKAPTRQIDPYVFFDDDGKVYLYHVRLADGNRIFVAEMTGDLMAVKEETVKECIVAASGWENTQKADWTVAEGPTVLKRNGLYYLFYSANDFRNVDYAVGYAVARSPFGPWEKTADSPIISRHTIGCNGTGHGDFFRDKNGDRKYVFHTHYSGAAVSPRRTAVISADFIPGQGRETDGMQTDAKTLFFPEANEKE
ncbi:MAG: glycoside hydrolase family 43 protein [Tannerellaceae bacterium]|jgi:beta-xylosidase|nr:glycoside hydrolase family 43 protein [Tannerellaceae bacterium]